MASELQVRIDTLGHGKYSNHGMQSGDSLESLIRITQGWRHHQVEESRTSSIFTTEQVG